MAQSVPTGEQGTLEVTSDASGVYSVGITNKGLVDPSGLVRLLPNPVVLGNITTYTFQVSDPVEREL